MSDNNNLNNPKYVSDRRLELYTNMMMEEITENSDIVSVSSSYVNIPGSIDGDIMISDFIFSEGTSSCTITSCGKNLVPPYSKTVTNSGVTFTGNGDGSIIVNGTATEWVYLAIFSFKGLGGNFVLSRCPEGGGKNIYGLYVVRTDNWKTGFTDYGSGQLASFSGSVPWQLRISINPGEYNNLVFRPQIEYGEVATDYEAYKGSTIEINSESTFPVYGLKSYSGVTNIFNSEGVDMTVSYPKNETGKAILGSAARQQEQIEELRTAIVAMSS